MRLVPVTQPWEALGCPSLALGEMKWPALADRPRPVLGAAGPSLVLPAFADDATLGLGPPNDDLLHGFLPLARLGTRLRIDQGQRSS